MNKQSFMAVKTFWNFGIIEYGLFLVFWLLANFIWWLNFLHFGYCEMCYVFNRVANVSTTVDLKYLFKVKKPLIILNKIKTFTKNLISSKLGIFALKNCSEIIIQPRLF